MYRKKKDVEIFFLCLTDLLCALISAYAGCRLTGQESPTIIIVFVLCIKSLVVFPVNFEYSLKNRDNVEEAKNVIITETYFLLAATLAVFALKNSINIGRRFMLVFLIVDSVIVFIVHRMLTIYRYNVYPKKSISRKVYLVAERKDAERVLDRINQTGSWDGQVIGIALLDESGKGTTIKGLSVVADRNNMVNFARTSVVDEVLIAIGVNSQIADMEDIIRSFQNMCIPVSVNIPAFQLDIPCDKRLGKLGGLSVITFTKIAYDYRYVITKRFIDIVGSIVGLIITAIASIFIIPAIKLDSPGPIIFAQDRVGKNGRVFKFYKFRSMYIDAEERKLELMKLNEMKGPMFKIKNDPRITKVGRFLRKTSLDELPQFLNVLKGDMSLVGTRPPTVKEYEQYEPYQKARLASKPGITGLWQVSGRSDITDFEEVVKLDLQYIDNWSIVLDIKILFKTIMVVFAHNGAR